VVAVVVLLLAYVAHESVWTASNWGAIWVLIVTQQVVMLLRSGVRVAQVSAEWHYFGAAISAGAVVPAVPAPPADQGSEAGRAPSA
jgi:hypothetical protein